MVNSSWPWPDPPKDFSDRDLYTFTLKENDVLYRFYDSNRPLKESLFFGKTGRNRYDDEDNKTGVLYGGTSIEACIVETIVQQIDNSTKASLTLDDLEKYSIVEYAFDHDIELVMFDGEGLANNEVRSEINGCEHSISQKWATAVIKNKNNYSGIYYFCAHNNHYISTALFEGRLPGCTIAGWGKLTDNDIVLDNVIEILYSHGISVK